MPKKLHPAVQEKANRMKELGVAYRRGDFGDMTWREVIKNYLGSNKPIGKKSKSKPKSKSKSKRKSVRRKRRTTKKKSRAPREFVYFDV